MHNEGLNQFSTVIKQILCKVVAFSEFVLMFVNCSNKNFRNFVVLSRFTAMNLRFLKK